ncbi:Uncharacterised protein [uncultured archaeon]|nr:Uncharacterised protein [uncultured archaeon]
MTRRLGRGNHDQMASILDRFLARLKPARNDNARDISLSEAAKTVKEEAESRISPAYPIYEKLCKAILNEAEAAKKAAKGVGEGVLDKSQAQYQIGLQMQRNFAERAPSALDALTMPERNYLSYARFHASALETVRSIAKISNDNRYLPHFLSAEIGAFGRRMNEVVRLTDELGAALALKREQVSRINGVERLEKEILSLHDELVLQDGLSAEIAEERRSLEAEISSAAARNMETELEERAIKQKVEGLRGQVSAERKRLTDQLSPFQRQFRKFQKQVPDKEMSRTIDAYISGPEDTAIGEVRGSGDYPALRKILSEMKTSLERGNIEDDAKIRARRISAIGDMLEGSLAAPCGRAIELEKELEKEENALSGVSKRSIHIEELQRRMAHGAEQLKGIGSEKEAGRKRMEAAFAEMESLVGETTGEKARIKRELG